MNFEPTWLNCEADAVSLAELQRTIDESKASAGPFAKELFAGPAANAAEVQALIHDSGDLSVATVSRNGRPHAALTIGDCVDGVVYFTSTDSSLLARNLAERPEVAFTCAGVMAAGRAEPVCACSSPPADLNDSLAGLCSQVTARGFDGTLWAVKLRRLVV